MGTCRRRIRMMKTVAIALLAAVAFAEPEAKAKADADPYLLYGGYYGHALGYAGYHYPAYGYAYYGKRSADAEPKADADPYLLYGGYYGLGYHGLDMDTTDIPMLTTERDPLMLSLRLRLMLTPTSCTEDTMDLDTMVLDMDTTDIPMLLRQEVC